MVFPELADASTLKPEVVSGVNIMIRTRRPDPLARKP
jgi:hypothetical protein